MYDNEKENACQEASERYNAYLDKVAETSKMSKSAFNLAKDYARAMEYNPDKMNARTFLKFLSDAEFTYTTGVMTCSIVRGSMQKYFNADSDDWGMSTRETNYHMLDCLDWEKESSVYINYQEWNEYENAVKDLWYNEGYRTGSVIKEYVKNGFMWNGIPPKQFNKMTSSDIFISDRGFLVFNDRKIGDDFLAKAYQKIVEPGVIFRKLFISQFKIREGRTKKLFEKRLSSDNHIMFSSPLNIYYSGEMDRHIRYGKFFDFDNELLIAYYLRMAEIIISKIN